MRAAERAAERAVFCGRLLIYADNIISLEFIRHSAVAQTCDHGRHTVALLHEVLRADGVIEALAKGDFTEQETMTGRVDSHG
jgi:hypothetical protein